MEYKILYNGVSNNRRGLADAKKLEEKLTDCKLEYVDVRKIDSYDSYMQSLGSDERVILCGGDGTLNYYVNHTTDATKVHNEFLDPIIKYLASDNAKSDQAPNPELIELICNRVSLVISNYTINKRLIRSLADLYQYPNLPEKIKEILDDYKNNHLSFFNQIKLYIQTR